MRMDLEGREVDLVEEGKETAAVTAAAMVVISERNKKQKKANSMDFMYLFLG